jgi:putative zinc finger/helix-turn-helix YgiT family protein
MHCRERAVSPTTVPSYPVEMEHDGRKYSFSVPNLDVLQCQNCREIILDDSANDRIFDALRVSAGLLTPAEIRQNRDALGYTQQQLADYLRISMFTLSRWETGAQIQQRAMDALLRVFFQSNEARRILGVPDEGVAWPEEITARIDLGNDPDPPEIDPKPEPTVPSLTKKADAVFR